MPSKKSPPLTAAEAKSILRAAQLRATAARVSVMQCLARERQPLTHAEVTERLSEFGFDQSTIYRSLTELADAGLLRGSTWAIRSAGSSCCTTNTPASPSIRTSSASIAAKSNASPTSRSGSRRSAARPSSAALPKCSSKVSAQRVVSYRGRAAGLAFRGPGESNIPLSGSAIGSVANAVSTAASCWSRGLVEF